MKNFESQRDRKKIRQKEFAGKKDRKKGKKKSRQKDRETERKEERRSDRKSLPERSL